MPRVCEVFYLFNLSVCGITALPFVPLKAYIRSLKRLKEQFKNWREVSGCGFDPSLLSDVAREVWSIVP